MIELVFKLLIAWQICHWAADYTHLSFPWMLKAKRTGSPLWPIFLHAMVHATLMYWVTVLFTHNQVASLTVYGIQLLTHFGIDVLKGKLNVWFPSLANPANTFHWYVFGGDQAMHQFVMLIQAFVVIKYFNY